MNLKQFLKPSTGKIVLTFVMSAATYSAAPGPLTVPLIGEVVLSPYLLFDLLLPGIEFQRPDVLRTIGIFYIYPLVFWYLVFSIIALVYSRVREKHKRST